MQERGTVAADADEAEAQRPQVEPQPQRKQRRRRITHKLQFKLKLVQLALARPRGHRIRPVCREFPEVEPVTPTPLRSCPLAPVSALLTSGKLLTCNEPEEQARQSMGECDETPRRDQRCRSHSPCCVCRACRPARTSGFMAWCPCRCFRRRPPSPARPPSLCTPAPPPSSPPPRCHACHRCRCCWGPAAIRRRLSCLRWRPQRSPCGGGAGHPPAGKK